MWWRRVPTSDAFGDLDRMRRDMERLFHGLEPYAFGDRPAGVFPLLNVTQDENSYFVRAELPGIQADELSITTTNNRLSLSGQRSIPAEQENASYHRREREGGTFNRSITLPQGVDTERVSASYHDGILSIELPKSAGARPRQISVKTA